MDASDDDAGGLGAGAVNVVSVTVVGVAQAEEVVGVVRAALAEQEPMVDVQATPTLHLQAES